MEKPSGEQLEHMRHSLAHLLAAAVRDLYPDAKPAIGPAIENGFYYDFDFPTPPSEKELPKIEEKMRTLLPNWTAFEHLEVSPDEAKARFKDNPYKCELIDEIVERGEPLTLYTAGEPAGEFTDLCRGGHVENPAKDIPADAFCVSHMAGAYWRGDEHNPMLTRIYGLAFSTKKELDAFRERQAEAEKRDHRKLGQALGLFTFSDMVGAGLPLFTPKGTILRDTLNEYAQELRERRGYRKTWVPHLTKTDLYKTSGHWEKFGHELFLVESQETEDKLVLKPMNCPHHTQIYAAEARSYRDLPLRFMETTTVYRDERRGELSGLSRVRSITQDDSHVFCAPEQIGEEYASIMDMVVEFYQTVHMQFRARLSFRNDEDNYLGDAALWEKAQSMLTDIAEQGAFEYFTAEGEAAFYGPKIDFLATDALGREHQLATAQLDFVQPERFGLEYTDHGGAKKTPVMIHLAIAGSLERFLSIYIEHTAGAFPLWAAPVQVRVLPIGEAHRTYAQTVYDRLRGAGFRAELDDDNETLGKKIRNAQIEKVPYYLVIGDNEVRNETVTLESREGKSFKDTPLDEVIGNLTEENQKRA